MKGKPEPMEIRFWRFVEKTEGCWLWTGAKTGGGYGYIRRSGKEKMSAHRASWEMHNGPVPEGLWVLHRCDTPACVRPDHLFVGTRADNMRDAHEKGRIDLSYVGSAPRPGRRK